MDKNTKNDLEKRIWDTLQNFYENNPQFKALVDEKRKKNLQKKGKKK